MIKIQKATTDDKKTLYRMTRGNTVQKMADLAGQRIKPTAWVLYLDGEVDEETGEVDGKQVLAIQFDNTIAGTISGTFIKTFLDMTDMLGDLVEFEVCAGKTKAGRTFIFPDPV